MKILFIGVFDREGKSTNVSQILSLKKLGHEVSGYNYRQKAALIGNEGRDKDLVSTIRNRNFDLVIYSKCNVITLQTFREINKLTKTCMWFMDPLITYDQEIREKTTAVDYFCCDKENVLEEALKINKNSFHVFEGYDSDIDKPYNIKKQYDISFIGNIYGSRAQIINQINRPVNIISNAYSRKHALEVSKSKINLNLCTAHGASDRVYKVLATKGFLISDDWYNREKYFIDGKDCVIFNDIQDLNKKIKYYLNNWKEAERIASNGFETVQKFTRLSWAKQIINLYDKIK
jgi:spore maturation protein CgeB